MPANKNAMTRYKIQDDLLSNRYHYYSLDDLTEKVNLRLSETNGVVRRTIEKELNYLEQEGPFWVDVERYTVNAYNPEKQKSYAKQCLRMGYSDDVINNALDGASDAYWNIDLYFFALCELRIRK